jgi:hypothetical protein
MIELVILIWYYNIIWNVHIFSMNLIKLVLDLRRE